MSLTNTAIKLNASPPPPPTSVNFRLPLPPPTLSHAGHLPTVALSLSSPVISSVFAGKLGHATDDRLFPTQQWDNRGSIYLVPFLDLFIPYMGKHKGSRSICGSPSRWSGHPFFLSPLRHTHTQIACKVRWWGQQTRETCSHTRAKRKGKSVTCQVSQPCLAHLGTVGRVGEMGTLERGQG